jgi:kynureninase
VLPKTLLRRGVICDFREPDVVRLAPVPLYTRFQDVYRLVQVLADVLH